MNKLHYLLTAVVTLTGIIFIILLLKDELGGSRSALGPAPSPIVESVDGLTTAEDFSIRIIADDVPGARDLELDALGALWVSQTSEGVVSLIEQNAEGDYSTSTIFRDLQHPHGLAFDPTNPRPVLYIAEEARISSVLTRAQGEMHVVASIPAGGRHKTRSLAFSEDGQLFVSIGSACDTCHEPNPAHGSVQKVNLETGALESFATGLRNSVFITFDSQGVLWGTEMGRDFLGDDLPPDEVNKIEEGKFYGWPICYGKNIHDTAFDQNTYIRNPCMEPFETPSFIDIPAHSAPLGLDFVPASEAWPEDWHGDLIVAYHGSWNRAEPTGYKLVRMDFDADGNYVGTEDFVTGWLTPEGALGRPVDVLATESGSVFVSDDKAGVVYEIRYEGEI